MIQTDDFHEHIFRIFLSVDGFHGVADDCWSIAQAGIFDFGVTVKRLAHHTGRIRQVDQISVRLRYLFHGMGNLQHGRYGLKAHEHTAGGCGLLADQTVFKRDRFIHISGIGHTRTDGGDHEITVFYCFFKICSHGDNRLHTGFFEHFLHISSCTSESVFVNVHQTPFSHLHCIFSFNKHLRNIRKIGRTS